MELTKQENQMAKGVAILAMVMLHLFCRLGDLPYTPLIWIGHTPLIYYLGLFGDICVPIYCFCSGYAQILLKGREQSQYRRSRWVRLFKFLLNYWIVLILFSIVGALFDKTGAIPGSVRIFLGNLFLYSLSYNGAWWFVLTYAFLIALSPLFIRAAEKMRPIPLFLVSGALYFVSYIFRFAYPLHFEVMLFQWAWEQLLLIGTSQFSFVLGMLFYQHKVISTLRTKICRVESDSRHKHSYIYIYILPVSLFLVHCVIKSLIIAPITGILTLTCFYLWDKPLWAEKLFSFFGKHSTNIWLVHMFYYLVLFPDLVFAAKYPIPIFALMLVLSVVTSYLINWIYQPIASKVLCAAQHRFENFTRAHRRP